MLVNAVLAMRLLHNFVLHCILLYCVMFVSSVADNSEFAQATVLGRVPILQTDNERLIAALVRFS